MLVLAMSGPSCDASLSREQEIKSRLSVCSFPFEGVNVTELLISQGTSTAGNRAVEPVSLVHFAGIMSLAPISDSVT